MVDKVVSSLVWNKCWWKFLSQTIFLNFRTSNLAKQKQKEKNIWLMEKNHYCNTNIPSTRHLNYNVFLNWSRVSERKNRFSSCNISRPLLFLLVLYTQLWAYWHYCCIDGLLAYNAWQRKYAKLSQRHRGEITSLNSWST